mgnify:FL=1|jgi:hypothetical protein|tara:strand:+ start:334 stop:510 length:177 start_codon:yes stop_codon:yes gene_type:complete
MNLKYIFDNEWMYWHLISIDSSRIWHTETFPNVFCEAYIYNLMLSSIQEKKKIEEKYN